MCGTGRLRCGRGGFLSSDSRASGSCQKLQLVHHQGVSWHDTTDWKTIRDRDIKLAVTLSGSTISVAEHTLMLMLAAIGIWHMPMQSCERRNGWLMPCVLAAVKLWGAPSALSDGPDWLASGEELVPLALKGCIAIRM